MRMEWRRAKLSPTILDITTRETRPGVPRVEVVGTKNDASRMLYFPGETGELLRELMRRAPVSPYAWARSWSRCTRKTVYSIQPGRGFAEASEILGEDYAGVLVADGWTPYQKFKKADHQTCLAHLLRRCDEMLEEATGGAVRFPRLVKEILQSALAVRDQREAGKISGEALEKAKEELESQMDRCLSGEFTNPSNLRLAQHLIRHQDQCFCSWNGRMWRQLTGGPSPRGIGRPRARRPKRS